MSIFFSYTLRFLLLSGLLLISLFKESYSSELMDMDESEKRIYVKRPRSFEKGKEKMDEEGEGEGEEDKNQYESEKKRQKLDQLSNKDLSNFPPEMILHILHFLQGNNLLSASGTCRTWRALAKELYGEIEAVIYITPHTSPDSLAKSPFVHFKLGNLDNSSSNRFIAPFFDLALQGKFGTVKSLNIRACHDFRRCGMIEKLKNFPKLTELSLVNSHVSKRGVEVISRLMPNLTSLDLSWNLAIADQGALSIAQLTNLVTLKLDSTCMGTPGVDILAEKLTKLVFLDLHGNMITTPAAHKLVKAPSLTSLNLGSNSGFRTPGVISLAKKNTSLTSLMLSNNDLSYNIGKKLFGNSFLTRLDLSQNSGIITSKALQVLENNTTLKSLKLRYCSLFVERPKLKTPLAHNNTLTELDLSENDLRDQRIKYFLKHFELRKLALRSCKISDEEVSFLSTNTSLTSLDLSDNGLTDEGVFPLTLNTTLKRLVLGAHCEADQLTDKTAKAFATNTTLTDLSLWSYNWIDRNGTADNLETLIQLALLSEHGITVSGVQALLTHNSTLTRLSVGKLQATQDTIDHLLDLSHLPELILKYTKEDTLATLRKYRDHKFFHWG